MENDELCTLMKDMVWLNAVIATELIQITENTSAILRKGNVPESCLVDHAALRSVALKIAEKCRSEPALRHHLTEHQ